MVPQNLTRLSTKKPDPTLVCSGRSPRNGAEAQLPRTSLTTPLGFSVMGAPQPAHNKRYRGGVPHVRSRAPRASGIIPPPALARVPGS